MLTCSMENGHAFHKEATPLCNGHAQQATPPTTACSPALLEDADERKTEISAAKVQLGTGGWFVQENAL